MRASGIASALAIRMPARPCSAPRAASPTPKLFWMADRDTACRPTSAICRPAAMPRKTTVKMPWTVQADCPGHEASRDGSGLGVIDSAPLILQLHVDGAFAAVVAVEVAAADVGLVGQVARVQLHGPVAVDLVARHQVEQGVARDGHAAVVVLILGRAIVAGAGRECQCAAVGQVQAVAQPEAGL